MRRKSCRSPAIKGMLGAFQAVLASKEKYPHTYRITLFKNFRDRKLKIFARSGRITLGSRTKFKINPDHEEKNAGIAGRCWFQGRTIVRMNLPDVSEQSAKKEDVIAYAQATFYDVNKLRKRDGWPTSRCIAGFPVMVNGKKWGALVFDSSNPQAISERIGSMHMVRTLLRAISEALQESENALDPC